MPLLDVHQLTASYGPVQVLRGLDFSVDEGEIVVLLGANGAGKTTTIRALCGMVDTGGTATFDGVNIAGASTEKVVKMGVAHVPQGRGTFADLSVIDNLEVGAYTRTDKAGIKEDIERWFATFPRLRERDTQLAGSLSGGEQQMLAVARAMMSRPRLLLLDEPSLGLAPLVVQELFRQFGAINQETGMTMFIVEQNANLALSVASRGYVLEAGTISLSGSSADLSTNDDVRRAYLGI